MKPSKEEIEFQEGTQNMENFEKFIKGTDFEKAIDAFFDKQIAEGKDPLDIYNNAVKNVQPKPSEKGDEQEINPSEFNIDKSIFESFQKLMDNKMNDPQMVKIYEELMNSPDNPFKEQQGGLPNLQNLKQNIEEQEELDDEEKQELEMLKKTKAQDKQHQQESPQQASKEELIDTAQSIFKKKCILKILVKE